VRVRDSITGIVLAGLLVGGCTAVQARRANRSEAQTGQTAISVAAAHRVLGRYDQVTRQADRDRDPTILKRVETGAALAAHRARLAATPAGRAVAHVEILSHVVIPLVAGYPKWFAAGALSAGDGPGWVAVFEKRARGGSWRAVHVVYDDRPMARPAVPAVAVPADDDTLVTSPGHLADRHAASLVRGARATAALFAGHRVTSGLSESLTKDRRFFSRHGWEGAEHVADADGKAYALRTSDGGAVVWYSLRVADQFTNRVGRYRVGLRPGPARLLGQRWVTERVSLEWRYDVVAVIPGRGETRPDQASKQIRILGVSAALLRASGF
jgi:hypothetical protein